MWWTIAALAQEPPGEAPEPQPALTPPVLVEVPATPWPQGQPYVPAKVLLLLVVDEQGAVEEFSLMEGEEPWASLAIDAAPGLVFEPAREGGQAIAVEVPFEWRFSPPPENLVGHLLVGEVPAARVTVLVGETALETDEEGRFSLRELPVGTYTVLIDDAVLQADPLVVEVLEGQLTELTLVARATGAEDEIVGVYVRRKHQVTTRTLTAEELRTTPGTMGDPVRAVQSLPGVVRTPFDSGWLMVRGGDPGDTGVYIDGVWVPLIYHLGGFTSVVHPAIVDGLAFMPVGGNVRYGRATSGTVELTTKTVESGTRIEAGADLLHSGAYVQLPLGDKTGIAIAARRSYLDKAMALVPSITEEQAQIAPRFIDYQVKVDRPNAGVFLLGYKDGVNAPTGFEDESVSILLETHRIHGRLLRATPFGGLTLTPIAAVDIREYDYTEDYYRQEMASLGLRAELLQDEGPVGWMVGLDGLTQGYGIQVITNQSDVSRVAWSHSVDPYAHVRFGEDERLYLGLRLETLAVQEQLMRWGVSPRAQGVLPLGRRFAIIGDAGVFHQSPPPDIMIGLPDGRYLDLERSWGVGAGLRWNHPLLGLEVDGYWRHLDNQTLFEDDGTLGQGAGVAYGVETLTRYDIGPLAGWVAYTWSRSLRQQETGDLYLPNKFDQPHYLVAVLGWSLARDLTLSGRFRYGTGYPKDSEVHSAYDLLTLTETPLDPQALRLQPFHALDLKVSKRSQLKRWEVDFYLDVQNVYNRRIAEPVITGIDDTITVYGYGLPVLPIFGVKGAFLPG